MPPSLPFLGTSGELTASSAMQRVLCGLPFPPLNSPFFLLLFNLEVLLTKSRGAQVRSMLITWEGSIQLFISVHRKMKGKAMPALLMYLVGICRPPSGGKLSKNARNFSVETAFLHLVITHIGCTALFKGPWKGSNELENLGGNMGSVFPSK